LKLGAKILLDAVSEGLEGDVKMILKQMDVDPNVKPVEAAPSPLHVATSRGYRYIMELLLESGAAVSARDEGGQTALHVAAKRNDGEAVRLLFEFGALPNVEDSRGRTPLWHAAWYESTPNTFDLLKGRGTTVINYECNDPKMPTALWAAAANGLLDRATALLTSGASAEVKDSRGRMLLHRVEWPAIVALAPLLIEKGADPCEPDGEGKLPLHRAAEQGRMDMVAHLLPRTPVDSVDGHGATALMLAARKGSLPLVHYLVRERGARWDIRDQVGNDAFYMACAKGHFVVATYLLGVDRNINEGNNEDDTPLHAAARGGHKEMVRALLDLRADKDAKSRHDTRGLGGQATPAQVAEAAGHEDIVKLIEKWSSDDPATWKVESVEPRRPAIWLGTSCHG
jgi:ankyrin repeat protein